MKRNKSSSVPSLSTSQLNVWSLLCSLINPHTHTFSKKKHCFILAHPHMPRLIYEIHMLACDQSLVVRTQCVSDSFPWTSTYSHAHRQTYREHHHTHTHTLLMPLPCVGLMYLWVWENSDCNHSYITLYFSFCLSSHSKAARDEPTSSIQCKYISHSPQQFIAFSMLWIKIIHYYCSKVLGKVFLRNYYFIQQGCIKLKMINSGNKDIYNIAKAFYFK